MENLRIDMESVRNMTLKYETLLICLSAIEKQINKYAYLSKKFRNADKTHKVSNQYELNKYIGYRTLLSKAIYPKYTISDIQTLIKSEYASAKCSTKIIDDIVILVKNGNYSMS